MVVIEFTKRFPGGNQSQHLVMVSEMQNLHRPHELYSHKYNHEIHLNHLSDLPTSPQINLDVLSPYDFSRSREKQSKKY